MQTHYDVLGITIQASVDEIKQAYRRLARQYHPDAPHGSTARFQALGQAYEILCHAEKRRQYDATLIPSAKKHPTPPKRQTTPKSQNPAAKDERSLWSSFPWHKGRAPTSEPPSKPMDIPVSAQQCQEGGKLTISWKEGKALKISIPKGAKHGDLLKMNTSEGPLLARVVLTQDPPNPQPLGDEGAVRLPLSLGEAITGTRVDVITPQGAVSLKIPPHTSSHRVFRLKGKGPRQPDGTVGDYLLSIQIVLPPALDPALMAFAAQWQNNHPYDVRPKA